LSKDRNYQNAPSADSLGPNGQRIEAGRSESRVGGDHIPSISLPKGGGAIRGMGEKFAANPVTGTGSITVPLAASPGRSGFGPQLTLSYDSGSGNGPFGLGWNLSIPAITRKTDKGLPKYRDPIESGIFILSGTEDLVPALYEKMPGQWVPELVEPRIVDAISYRIDRFRPRIEGLFARIERWTNEANPSDCFWRSISRNNITSWYGKTDESRIRDPFDSSHIFSWLICESHDDKGNVISYRYKLENSDNVDDKQAHERNRSLMPAARTANRYIKHIRYGNHDPYFPQLLKDKPWPSPAEDKWFFEVVFDYGEHHTEEPLPRAEISQWKRRPDPFSSYRSCFEVRTYRLCQRMLMFHHFDDEENVHHDCLVRSTDLTYSYEQDLKDPRNPIHSVLLSVSQSGYKRQPGGYLKRSLPPLEFDYSRAEIDETVREVDWESLENLPYGLDGANYKWVDLDGEGLSGILTEQGDGWFYKRNLSPLNAVQENGEEHFEARFAPMERVAEKPSLTALGSGRQQLLDLAGDGQLDLVALNGPALGFYERTQDGHWETFRPFLSLPNLEWDNPNLKFVDLTGDGHADVMITEDDVFCWYPSLAEDGFAAAQRVAQAWDEERGPRIVFADGTQAIHLADVSGDGLSDLVRIRNGEVCYWPNLGYGRFGAKVTMDNPPWFDNPDQFNQQRIHLADVDGSALTDIIYLGRDGVRIYFNQSGNSWGEPNHLSQFPSADNLSSVVVVDLLGNGTACFVWSSPLPVNSRRPMRYIDLMGGQKPHLLVKSNNNLGAETVVKYAPSTKFYLEDKIAGNPWITRIPFPVHVVERVETFDRISGNRFTARHAYHHGYFDGAEREFRGFGMVEQWDTEEFATLNASQVFPGGSNVEKSSQVPPVLTRTWFHTGVHLGRAQVSDFFAGLSGDSELGEYYREPGLTDAQARQLLLDDTVLPAGLTVEGEREACRALKGAMLRQEVYALDGTGTKDYPYGHPYTVTEQNFSIHMLQPRGDNPHAVFFTHARETVNYHYERSPADPRIGHALTLAVDEFGNVLKAAAVGYGRRQPDPALEPRDRSRQAERLITYTENDFTNRIDTDDGYRTPLLHESRTYELTAMVLPAGSTRFSQAEMLSAGIGVMSLAYEKKPIADLPQKRLIEHVRTLYRSNNLVGPLPLGVLQSLALPFESYRLALTPGLVTEVYGGRVTNTMLGTEGRYTHSEGDSNWWIPSGRTFHSPDPDHLPSQELTYAQAHFYLPHRYRDPFHTNAVGTEMFVSYDAYDLLVQETRDSLGNRISAGERNLDPTKPLEKRGNDYRVLQPKLMMDPNRNRSAVAFDSLGMVVGTAVMGKPEDIPRRGDLLDGFDPDLTDVVIAAHLQTPFADPRAILLQATTRLVYDLFAYHRTRGTPNPQPSVVYALARETHDADLAPGQETKIQHSFSYSDGFGREIQKKIQAERGPVPRRDLAGKIIVAGDGQPLMTATDVSPRWVGGGWTIFNNKGKPVRQFEPFFTDTHGFEFDVRIGVSPVVFYDPVERVVATLYPNHTWEKVVFDPWRQETWDASDTVLITDPKTDPEVGDFFHRLPNAEYLPTWYAKRTGGGSDPEEEEAARKAAVHASTPVVAHADSLGRTFLTTAHNKHKYSNTSSAGPPVGEFQSTRVVFDIEGNQRAVIDAKDRTVMRYDYDLLGNRIHQASMEAGERWMLNDVAGKSLYAWDSRDHRFHTTYDALRRPTEVFLQEGADADLLVGRTIYGESRPTPEANNLRGKVFQVLDQAGIVTSDDYDFKGNLLSRQRQLAQEYSSTLVWPAVPLDASVYSGRTRYDALNRPIQWIAPHSNEPDVNINVTQPIYNEANLLEQVHVWLDESAEPLEILVTGTADLHAITNIDYDAKGQRRLIEYGNSVATTYSYDPLTFRLVNLLTRRAGIDLQNLNYTYDPVGNITHLRDDAQQSIFFSNKLVEPRADYTYDALYRLIEATGREHLGQLGAAPSPASYNDTPRVGTSFAASDGNAMARYLERYVYDVVGNFETIKHLGTDPSNPGWLRTYTYGEPSLTDAGKQNNRLTRTAIGPTTEIYSTGGNGYDAHGNLLRLPHLQEMRWDFRDQLRLTRRQAINPADIDGAQHQGERTWYVYDSSGERVRKVTEVAAGVIKDERIYLGGFEIFRRHGATPLVRETLHIMDDKQRIALVEMRTAGIELDVAQRLIRFQFGNHLGSASLELDDRARIISYEEFTPYGSTSFQAVDQDIKAAAKRYRYTGKERDEETGFTYHGARYYAPWLGRWVSCDPIETWTGNNPYIFVKNTPTRLRDITGLTGTEPKPNGLDEFVKDVRAAEKLANAWFGPLLGPTAGIGPLAGTLISGKNEEGKAVDRGKVAIEAAESFIPGYGTLKAIAGGTRAAIVSGQEAKTKADEGKTREAIRAGVNSLAEGIGVGNVIASEVIAHGAAPKGKGRLLATVVPSSEEQVALATTKAVAAATHTPPAAAQPHAPATNAAKTNPIPTPAETEQFTESALKSSGGEPQKSYTAGQPSKSRSPGSTRPDVTNEAQALAIDAKNYSIQTKKGRTNLVNNVVDMVAGRAENLPLRNAEGKPYKQGITIEARGRTVSDPHLHELVYRITVKTGGLIGPFQIWFIF
jgi:RHS repeat-associated protein